MGFRDKLKNVFGSGKKEDIKTDNPDEKMNDKSEPIKNLDPDNNSNVKEDVDSTDSRDDYTNGEMQDMPAQNPQIRNFQYLVDLINSGTKEIVLDSDIEIAYGEYEIISGPVDYFERDKYIHANRGIFINSDVVIDGQGHSIDASGFKRIIYIIQGNVTLKNIIFKNGYSQEISGPIIDGQGGAIHNKGNLTLINCIFEGNSSKTEAGAIFNDGNANLNIISCKFLNNSAQGASAIKNYGKLTLTNCTFNGNESKESCLIVTDNLPQLIGGGIVKKTFGRHDDAFLDCYGCKFSNNKSHGDALVIETGSYTRIVNSNFILNENPKEGHIIYQYDQGSHNDKYGDNHTLVIMGASFSCNSGIVKVEKGFCNLENMILDIVPSDYAVSNINASVSINGIKFKGHAENLIYNNGILKINKRDNLEEFITSTENSTIKYYTDSIPADWKGFEYLDGLIAKSNGEVHLDCDITMHDVEQSFYEGGIELSQDNLLIDGEGHTIDASHFSRIFNVCGENIKLKNIRFKNGLYFKHYMDSVDNGGGVINVIQGASLKIQDCEFIGNASRNSGGVLFNKGTLEICDSNFEDNFALRYGGVVNNKSELTIDKCEFKANEVIWEGGVVNNHGNLKITTSTFNNNNAGGDYNGAGGGVIKNIMGRANVYDSLFKKNSTGDEGGVVNNWGGSAQMTKCTFEDNSAYNGDVIYSQAYFVYIDRYDFNECEFINNDSTFDKDIED
ncbi:right-handed parallel beta-helix repeat-containing protein [Methanobrevibacter sp.]|uniref:right-handed parallel beta-helix repeat-containing protein n=1 Tax=Methanobrevibacter sp. TaxID=66852 RepID=UPI00388F139C